MSNSNASASDSANIKITRSPLIYPEPISMIKAVGKFECKIERVGGLVETFEAYNAITTPGRQALLGGITNAQRAGTYAGTPGKVGLRFSTATAPAASANGTFVSGFASGTNLDPAVGSSTVETATGPADCWTLTGDADIFGTAFASNGDDLTSNAIKVVASGGASGALTSILLVDCTSTAAGSAFVFAGAAITATLSADDTLEATYKLTIA